MKNNSLLSALFISLPILFAACAKDGAVGPQGTQGSTGPGGPILTGNLKGYVSLFDQYGSHVLVDQDSALVSLVGVTAQAYTDSAGKYAIAGLSTGVYTVNCSKSGYGANQVNSLGFTGGGDLYRDIRISAIPSFHVDSISLVADPNVVTITGSIAMDTRVRTVLVFVGNGSNTSNDPAHYLGVYNRNVPANQGNFMLTVPLTDLANLGITSGQTAYFAAYGATANYNNASSYEDLATGRTWFTAVSTAPANRSVLIP